MKIKKIEKNLKDQIHIVLNREFISPFVDSIKRDPVVSIRLSNAFALTRLSEELIVEFDKDQNQSSEEVESIKEKSIYLGYLGKVFQSALLLMGATDYIGAIILFRAIFELLINIATEKTGPMKERIFSINFIDETEKRSMHKIWNELSAWAHPYGKWIKNVCPKFYGVGRNYHPDIFRHCLKYSDAILDLMLIITVDRFKISTQNYINKYNKIFDLNEFYEINDLMMFKARIESNR